MNEITIWRPSSRSQRLRLEHAAFVILEGWRIRAGRSEGRAERANKPAGAWIEKRHENMSLPGPMRLVVETSAEADPELRNVGRMRIMGGISARRAVHRCPVADVFWAKARRQTTQSIYQPRQRERQGLFNERI